MRRFVAFLMVLFAISMFSTPPPVQAATDDNFDAITSTTDAGPSLSRPTGPEAATASHFTLAAERGGGIGATPGSSIYFEPSRAVRGLLPAGRVVRLKSLARNKMRTGRLNLAHRTRPKRFMC